MGALLSFFSKGKKRRRLAGEAGAPPSGGKGTLGLVGWPGGGRSPFSTFPFLAAPERAALFPRGRAPEGLGWVGKLTDEKAIVKKSCLGVQVGRSFLSVVLFIQWGNTSLVLRAI